MNELPENRNLANHLLTYIDNNQYLTFPFLIRGKFHLNTSLRNMRSLAIASKGWQNLIFEYCKSKYPEIPLNDRTIQYRDQLTEIAFCHSVIIAIIKNTSEYRLLFSLMETLMIKNFYDLSYSLRQNNIRHLLFPYYKLRNNIIFRSEYLKLKQINNNQLLILCKALHFLQEKEHLSFNPLVSNVALLKRLLSSQHKFCFLKSLDCWAPNLGLKGVENL